MFFLSSSGRWDSGGDFWGPGGTPDMFVVYTAQFSWDHCFILENGCCWSIFNGSISADISRNSFKYALFDKAVFDLSSTLFDRVLSFEWFYGCEYSIRLPCKSMQVFWVLPVTAFMLIGLRNRSKPSLFPRSLDAESSSLSTLKRADIPLQNLDSFWFSISKLHQLL